MDAKIRRGKGISVKGVAAFALAILMVVALFGSLRPERESRAEEAQIIETEEISVVNGNGPQKITSIGDMGWKESSMQNMSNSSLCPGTITDNKVSFLNFSENYYSFGLTSNGWVNWDKNYGSGSALNKSIPVSMNYSWKLSAKVFIAKPASKTGEFTYLGVKVGDKNTDLVVEGGVLFSANKMDGGEVTFDDLGIESDMVLSYDAVNNIIKFVIGGKTVFEQANPIKNTATIRVGALRGGSPKAPTKNLVSYFEFSSFEYTDYYLKAVNCITDYAGRNITGAVGNGHNIGVHTKVLNNNEASPANTQRFSGTVSINGSSSTENIVPQSDTNGNNVTQSPIAFKHDGSPDKDVTFNAKVDTAGSAYVEEQKFQLPLLIKDNYFGNSANFAGLTGVPANWYNMNNGDVDKLPLELKLVRNTCRPLTHDLQQKDQPAPGAADYTHTINGQPVEPNTHGWYNNNVTINFLTDASEFNELNFSTASGDTKIAPGNIVFTAESGESLTVRGVDSSGNPTPTEETSEDGLTFSVFGRKGTDDTTRDLSAVTTETFRIDKTAPTLKVADKEEQSDPRRLQAKDTLSGIDYIKWKGPNDSDYSEDQRIIIETDPSAVKGTKEPTAQKLPAMEDFGDYTFIAVDLAGNESEPLILPNNRPTLTAEGKTIKFNDTISGFKPLASHAASAEDEEDGAIDPSRVKWKIERTGFATITGTGENTLPDGKYLPIGTYTVTFYLDGNGGDSDGNKPDPEQVEVELKITSGDPPIIVTKDDPDAGTIDGTSSTRPDGTRHYQVEDEKTIVVNTDAPYSGGSLSEQELKAEVEREFNFTSKIPAPADDLEVELKVFDEEGDDITGTPISTTKRGSYTVIYVATDKSGCTTTLQLTYTIKADATVTFHPGKGDYKDGGTSRTLQVRVNTAPAAEDIPDGKEELTAPAKTCFIGWGTSSGAAETADPAAVSLSEDTTYYAVYGADINENGIPDSEEAIFIFKSDDPEHAAFKYADKTMVGILAPAGTAVSLSADKIPDILFDRTDDTGYRLSGWKTDATGDELLTTEELCALGRNAGTRLTVTAMITTYPIEAPDKVKVTFFSSDPENAPLEGGEGQSIYIDAPKEGEPVYLSEAQIPAVKLTEGSRLEGWKMEKTGDQLMEVPQVTSQDLYPGETVAVVAYVKTPPKNITEKVEVPVKGDGDSGKKDTTTKDKIKEKTKTVTKKEIITKKQTVPIQKEKYVTFAFYSSSLKNGSIRAGDGTIVKAHCEGLNYTSLGQGRIPKLLINEKNSFAGWRTSVTGSRLLTNEELGRLKAAAGAVVNCTAIFRNKNVNITETDGSTFEGGDTSALTTLPGEQVPLGSSPFSEQNRSKSAAGSCIIHFLMLIWLAMLLLTVVYRLHKRKGFDKYLYMDKEELGREFASIEEYEEMAAGRRTNISDYIFTACSLLIGGAMYIMGYCSLELPALLIGLVISFAYLLRMKILDHKLTKAGRELRRSLNS